MKIFFIKWVDACRVEQYHKDVATPKGQELGLQTTYSVGIVIKDTKEYIALAQTLSDSGWYREITNIPKVSIIKSEVLNGGKH